MSASGRRRTRKHRRLARMRLRTGHEIVRHRLVGGRTGSKHYKGRGR